MKVRTTTRIRAERERLWPLLTSSQMTATGTFCLGLPQPLWCELPAREGGVGAERRCVSDRGTVIQVITDWQPPARLRFRMVSTDHAWGRCVASLEDEFLLEDEDRGTRLTRITRYAAVGFPGPLKEGLLWFGLKRVHLYVFENWRREAEVPPGGDPAPITGPGTAR